MWFHPFSPHPTTPSQQPIRTWRFHLSTLPVMSSFIPLMPLLSVDMQLTIKVYQSRLLHKAGAFAFQSVHIWHSISNLCSSSYWRGGKWINETRELNMQPYFINYSLRLAGASWPNRMRKRKKLHTPSPPVQNDCVPAHHEWDATTPTGVFAMGTPSPAVTKAVRWNSRHNSID